MKNISNKESRNYVERLEEFKGSNLFGRKEGNSYVVYSYGWYPILAFVANKWFENGDKYSQSTSRQLINCLPSVKTMVLSHEGMKDILR